MFFWFFWSLIFRNMQQTIVFLFCSGSWETLVLPACFQRVSQKPEKQETTVFFVCFWKVATRRTRKTIVFCMFLSMTSSESYKNNSVLHMRPAGTLIEEDWTFSTYANRWPLHWGSLNYASACATNTKTLILIPILIPTQIPVIIQILIVISILLKVLIL